MFSRASRINAVALTAAGCLAAVVSGCRSAVKSEAPALSRFEFQQPQMGVPFRIVLFTTDRAKAEAASTAAFRRVAELNNILSDYEYDSELSTLSRTAGSGTVVPLSRELWTVLSRAQHFAAETGGAFDVTVGPYVSAWRRARRDKKLPDATLLNQLKQAVGYQHLQLDAKAKTATLKVPRMRLDLGGIAKGYAADEALAVLRSHGVTRALIAASGDITVGDPPPGKAGWRIEVTRIDVPGGPPQQHVLLSNAAIATSGDLFQRLDIDGKRYSHIVDPRTGIGLTDHSLVTVIARDGITADSLATSISVLGPKEGLKLVERTRGAAARILRQPADRVESHESRRFKKFIERN